MQESMLALGALMIITMISVNQQRNNYLIQENAYIREMENIASDYGQKRMEQILNQSAFDESRIGATDLDIDMDLLTSAASFGPEAGETSPDTFDDVDDFHGYNETIRHSISVDTLGFDVTYSLRYVDVANPSAAASSPTLAKELTINVQAQDSIGHKSARFTISKLALASDGI